MHIFVKISGEKSGPFALEQLSDWIRTGRLRHGDYLLTEGKSVLLKPEHISELITLLEEEEGSSRRENFRKWIAKTLAFNTVPPRTADEDFSALKEENRRLTERLTELEREVETLKGSDEEREEELRRILDKKKAVDRERRELETIRERLERGERKTAKRSRVSVYAAIATVFLIITVSTPFWYAGIYRPSKEAETNAMRAVETYRKANDNLTEILYLHDEVQILYEKLNRLNSRFEEERVTTSGKKAADLESEFIGTAIEIERVSRKIEKAVPGSVSFDVLVLPTWPAGDDPARTDEVLEAKLRPRRNLVLSAYGMALMENPEVRGYVLVSAEIGRDGLVNVVDIKKTTIDAPIVKDACKKTFEFTNFGKAESDTTCLFKFAFEPEG